MIMKKILLVLVMVCMFSVSACNKEEVVDVDNSQKQVEINDEQAKTDIINQSLKNGEEILVDSGLKWEVSEKEVKAVLDKISFIMQMKYIDIADGNYDIAIYSIKTDTSASPRLFILNADSSELIFYLNLDKTLYSDILNMLN